MNTMERLVYLRRNKVVGRLAREIMLLYGLDIPPGVHIGPGLILQHRGMGTVIHPLTIIESNVTIYHQVTIGRLDAFRPYTSSDMQTIEIGAGAILFPGAKILGGPGLTRIGARAIVGANSVVTASVPDDEVWAGSPARRVSRRSAQGHSGGSQLVPCV